MTPEQLLLRRFKYVQPYPDSQYRLGEIITIVEEQDEWKFQKVQRDPAEIGDKDLWYDATKFWECPANFTELNWWEERQPDDFPSYLKSKDEKAKKKYVIASRWRKDGTQFQTIDRAGIKWTKHYLPATEEEFLVQQKPDSI